MTRSARRPLAGDGAERGEEQRGLADARLAAEQHERGGHEAASEDAVELRHARGDPRSLLDANVPEPLRRAWSARGGLSVATVELLHQRPERAAAGALAEPASRGRTALGTAELDDDLGHAAIVRERVGRYPVHSDNTTAVGPAGSGRAYSPGVEHGHAHGAHDHRSASRRALAIVLALTVAFTVVEVVGGLFTGSLAVLADAGHMLSDTFAIGLALVALDPRRAPLDASPQLRLPAGRDPRGVRQRAHARGRERLDRLGGGSAVPGPAGDPRWLDAGRRARRPGRERDLGRDPPTLRGREPERRSRAAPRDRRPARLRGRPRRGGDHPGDRLDGRRPDRLGCDRAADRRERMGRPPRLDRDPDGADAAGHRRGGRRAGDRLRPRGVERPRSARVADHVRFRRARRPRPRRPRGGLPRPASGDRAPAGVGVRDHAHDAAGRPRRVGGPDRAPARRRDASGLRPAASIWAWASAPCGGAPARLRRSRSGRHSERCSARCAGASTRGRPSACTGP